MEGARSMHCTENKFIKNTGRRAGREIYFLLFCNMTKKLTINLQIITLFLHVSTYIRTLHTYITYTHI